MSKASTIRLPVVGNERAPAKSEDGGRDALLKRLLKEQGELSAVERFSQLHDKHVHNLNQSVYRSLLPATTPGPGQQYAFEVNLDACTGCKACVAACHSLNGLDSAETWRSVGVMHGGTADTPVQRTVTTACHHCVEPACQKGCPVAAYEKDEETGIVRHLDDQCIGCQYCMLMCPYEVPQYNESKGIVRKCDMCSDRLKVGEAPACVQACPNGAIKIAVVAKAQAIEDAQTDTFLPGAPSPGLTIPTTQYKTERALPRNMMAADFYALRPAHDHRPLAIMLVLTQLSIGAFMVEQLLLRTLGTEALAPIRSVHAMTALSLGIVALAASTLHLGRPLYAFRAVLGVRTSWMSREILVLGMFAGLAALYAFSVASGRALAAPGESGLLTPLIAHLPESVQVAFASWSGALGLAVSVVGAIGVYCSAMIYHVTRKRFWHLSITGFKFAATTAVLGIATTLVTVAMALVSEDRIANVHGALLETLSLLLAISTALKLLGESAIFLHLRSVQHTELRRTAVLMTRDLARPTFGRYIAGVVGGIALPVALLEQASRVWTPSAAAGVTVIILMIVLAGEFLERSLFFRAVSASRMPGALA